MTHHPSLHWTQTTTGRKLDLLRPDPTQIDFANDVAPALGKLARFNGHTVGYPAYSVAQHCVMGAEGLWAAGEGKMHEGGRVRMAALFLLHDCHEFAIGDITTPVVAALDAIRWPDGPPAGASTGLVGQLVKDLKHRLDVAIYQAAGVAMPTEAEAKAIKHWDARMMRAERLAFMAESPEPWPGNDDVEPCRIDVDFNEDTGLNEAWDQDTAAREWLWAFQQYVVGA